MSSLWFLVPSPTSLSVLDLPPDHLPNPLDLVDHRSCIRFVLSHRAGGCVEALEPHQPPERKGRRPLLSNNPTDPPQVLSPFQFLFGVSQKGSRERCLPAFFLKMKRKKRKKTETNGRNGKTERNGRNGRKRKKTEKKTEKIGSDTVPATPFAKPRFVPTSLMNRHRSDNPHSLPLSEVL